MRTIGPVGSTIKIRKPKGFTVTTKPARDPFILGAIVAVSLMAGFGFGMLTVGDGWLERPPIVSTTPRPAGTWRFQPQPDMTPAEAAASIALMVMGPDFIPAVGERIEAMPPELRRHWLAPETK